MHWPMVGLLLAHALCTATVHDQSIETSSPCFPQVLLDYYHKRVIAPFKLSYEKVLNVPLSRVNIIPPLNISQEYLENLTLHPLLQGQGSQSTTTDAATAKHDGEKDLNFADAWGFHLKEADSNHTHAITFSTRVNVFDPRYMLSITVLIAKQISRLCLLGHETSFQ